MKASLVSAVLALFLAQTLAADQPAAPAPAALPAALPAQEHFLYARTLGEKSDTLEISSRLVSSKGLSWYEVTSHYPDEDVLMRLDPTTLVATYTEVTSRGKDATLKRVTSVLENRHPRSADEILVSGPESMAFSLRLFPWGLKPKARISFLGMGSENAFAFDLTVIGKENVIVAGKPIACWKAKLGLGGILGSLFGSSYYWYLADYPHYLVKSEGSSAGPGSPNLVLVLTSYSTGPTSD